jgi:hypothetical protein
MLEVSSVVNLDIGEDINNAEDPADDEQHVPELDSLVQLTAAAFGATLGQL